MIALLVVVGPIDDAVPAEHHTFCLRVFLTDALHFQSEFEAGPLPIDPDDVAPIHFLRDLLAMLGRRYGEAGHRVRVIDMLVRHEAVEGRVDRGRPGIEVVRAVLVHVSHCVLRGRLHATLVKVGIDILQSQEFLLIQGREVLLLRCSQVSTGSLHPKDFHLLSRQGIGFSKLRRGVASTGVGDAPVRPKQVRSINKTFDWIELAGLLVIPEVVDVLKCGLHCSHYTAAQVDSKSSSGCQFWMSVCLQMLLAAQARTDRSTYSGW
jgi:hypothetical protein